MNESEDKATRIFERIFQDVFGDSGTTNNGDGNVVITPGKTRMILKPGQHSYLYFDGRKAKMFCYTPWKDENGHYWVWDFVPVGPWKKARRWKLKNVVRCSKRKLAKKKTLNRLRKNMEV